MGKYPAHLGSLFLHDIVWRLFGAYVSAHLFWFEAVRKRGCCCCIIFCCYSHLLILLSAILTVLYGVQAVWNSLSFLNLFDFAWLIVIAYSCYGILLIYFGIALFKYWQDISGGKI